MDPLTRGWTPVSLDALRGEIAALVLGADDAPRSVGSVTLWPHQRDAVARLASTIASVGGALLADDVGTGKTFVALALAARFGDPLVVAPAALREVWRAAAERCAVRCRFASMESLSRGEAPRERAAFVIVDEAHHARNPATRRYARLAALVAGAPVLLLSATPVHNSRADLVALLALFLGARAATLDDASLARCVVRRSRDALAAGALPRVDGPHPLHPGASDDAIADAILALPPALPAADAGSAHALLLVTMIRQWESSALALRRGVERQLAAAHAIERSLEAGRHPTRAELAAWSLGADAQQLALPELLVPPAAIEHVAAPELRDAVTRHAAALRELARLAAHDDVDRRRAACLLDAWRSRPGERLLAFTQFADTVDAYWRELRGVARVCALTARGARIASGAIARDVALAAFAPTAGASAPALQIAALITTDLASEGLDLQGASVLAHLDLPWTPARLEQRVGRVLRPGSRHEVVSVLTMEPPARAAALTAIRERLAAKLAAARVALGPVMPALLDARTDVPGDAAPSELAEAIRDRLRRWSGERRAPRSLLGDEPVRVAGVGGAAGRGWLALYGGDPPRLAASLGGQTGDNLVLVAAAVAAAEGAEVAPRADDAARALEEALRWRDERFAAALAGVPEVGTWSVRRRALSRLAAAEASPRSHRGAAANALAPARAVATGVLGADTERTLAKAAQDRADPRSWLDAAPLALAPRLGAASPPVPPRLVALVLLGDSTAVR